MYHFEVILCREGVRAFSCYITCSFAAAEALSNGGSYLDAVEQGCAAAERNTSIDSVGYGGRYLFSCVSASVCAVIDTFLFYPAQMKMARPPWMPCLWMGEGDSSEVGTTGVICKYTV